MPPAVLKLGLKAWQSSGSVGKISEAEAVIGEGIRQLGARAGQ